MVFLEYDDDSDGYRCCGSCNALENRAGWDLIRRAMMEYNQWRTGLDPSDFPAAKIKLRSGVCSLWWWWCTTKGLFGLKTKKRMEEEEEDDNTITGPSLARRTPMMMNEGRR
mmetsp:Transcript_6758/g.18892  ORF Transcript_6758/g.18892 Transcript_6758/m.18892 type:complete len:112 (+) Transcript_6758:2538-2873(+)